MRIIILFALCLAAVSAVPSITQRIVGGSLTTIDKYPSIVSIIGSIDGNNYICGGTILNDKSILTAAHCAYDIDIKTLRARVGSSFFIDTDDGVVHKISSAIIHPNYDPDTYDSDIAILRTATTIEFNDVVKPVSIAGANYDLGDNEEVWTAGWGLTSNGGQPSKQLRDVKVMTINQSICKKRYRSSDITDNMLCSGVLDKGGRDSCQGDSGGPLYHKGVQVGVVSFGEKCASDHYPGVNARVSRFADWIKSNQ